jgi:hypothetical protein
MRIAISILLIATLLTAGCTSSGPLRKADQTTLQNTTSAVCAHGHKYRETDADILRMARDFQKTNDDRNRFLATEAGKIPADDPCWVTSHEQHDTYDLFYTEFDDEGNATDTAKGAAYRDSELSVVEKALPQLLDAWGALNIVVFTHGWHGSARATDSYSIEFKGLLLDITEREGRLAIPRKQPVTPSSKGESAKTYHTVGIEIAWRGDSFDKYINVWDRKLAADTISKGGVHELLAFLNQFYLDYSCHGSHRAPGCGTVHLLSIGHSFGALIDFQAFVGRLESGLNVDACDRAYGFGDMTVLLNPAFEGARYRSFFNTAMNRSNYFGDPNHASSCPTESSQPKGEQQVPTVVTLQSLGDWATGTTFPIFRWFSTRFAQTLSEDETIEQLHAIGWVNAFRTHELDATPDGGMMDRCEPDPTLTSSNSPRSYCPFNNPHVKTDPPDSNRTSGLVLQFNPQNLESTPPPYMPAWSVAVDKHIMHDHDDFWNPQIVRLISLLFEDAYEQSERLHGRR